MAEGLATGLAIEAAKAATTLVAGRVLEGMTQAWGFKDQLKKLKTNITYIQAFLEDVAKAKNLEKRSKFVDLFLKDITEVVYSTEELMDDYEYELLRRKIELKKKNNHPSFKKKCNNFFRPATNPVVFHFRMSRRVQKIQSMLDELKTNARNNGIQLGQLARDAVATTSRGGYFAENEALHETRKHAMARDSSFVGRKDDKEMLLQNILNPIAGQADHLSIVSIVGIGGLGKTTIAQKLYEHDKVGGHFDKRIWICVSEDFRVDRLLNEMIESLTSTKSDLTNPDAITRKLQQHLEGKKYLMVLDDVWEDDQGVWDSFKNALLRIGGDLRGCVILITTRLNDVARKARALYQYKLPELSEDEGWNLLQQRVFTETLFPFNSCFEDVGRRIVKKCKGVPLAIKAIGGILQSKKLPYEWESVENSELWGIQQTGDDVNNIMPWLLLSYNHLDDAYLKQCFAYCAIFPKDSKMEKHQLITLWLSQGYLQHESATSSSTSTLEIVGENYFNTLLNHSFLEKELEFFGITLYKMHDLVHDLATYILKKDLLVWKVGMNLEDEFSHVRHLVFHLSNHEEPSEIFTRGLQVRKLRTIRFQADHDWINSPTLGSAQFIRTLIMANTGLKEVPSIIGQLVHLRYLDLSYNDEIDVLPESICKLYQLQTLRILFCNKLKKLPTELYKLQNLRHIVNEGYSMWASRRLGQLTNLQTIPPLELRDGEGWSIDELGPLHQLKGKVFIKGLEHVKDRAAARKANLGMKENIDSLRLEWGKDREAASLRVNNDEDVLESLEPHPNLQSLYVKGFMGVSFPRWMIEMVVNKNGLDHPTPLTNLTEVDIIDCRRCRQLPKLGQLPFLQWLCLQGLDDLVCIGDEFYQRSSSSYNNNSNNGSDLVRVTTAEEEESVFFPSLRMLKILKCERLATWNPPSPKQAGAIILFPKLEALHIENCPQLEEVLCLQLHSLKDMYLENVGGTQPLDDIIKYSHALTRLEVRKMEKMMKLPEEVSNCTNLETLLIGNCVNMKSIPSGLISLKRLYIENCPSLDCIPDNLPSLHKLDIQECRSLACIPDSFASLQKLRVKDCEGLERVPKSLEECTSLEKLKIENCPLIKGPVIPDLGRLHGLKQLGLVNSGELKTNCVQWIPNLHHLSYLTIDGDNKDEWDFNLTFPQSLTGLELIKFRNVKSLPQQFLPCTLQSLKIRSFDELEQLPDWIGNLSSLRTLGLWNCEKLKHLPSRPVMMRLSKLQYLNIRDCPLLKERCAEEDGPEWHKISHIPSIDIN